MAAAYCYEGTPLRFLASLFDIQMRYLVYMRYLWFIRKMNNSVISLRAIFSNFLKAFSNWYNPN